MIIQNPEEYARSSKETIYAGSEAGKAASALGTRLEAPFGVRVEQRWYSFRRDLRSASGFRLP
jgi:hypothetical protein